ncbi:MAG: anaerobic glycerol-3-phosphate dehydrogenase subunit C [Planctomycetales bacterium]|nr:anaerobic glycerol-3-phosphate dehydrogenase subunit C [Planctomycetales bacterium]
MDQQRERVEADLRGIVRGEVLCDDLYLQMYASDASIYELRPAAVVRPLSTADVVACVQYAGENGISIHARGAGTGLAGESLGRGIVLDFSAHMRRILKQEEDRVVVQPGVTLGNLNRQLAAHGRCFGPDPANREITTIGSVLAIDASGSHWPLYGTPRDNIESVEVVLATGDVATFSRQNVSSLVGNSIEPIVRQVKSLIESNYSLIQEHQPNTLVNRAGYRLDDVLFDDDLELAKLMIGSEGTLGIITRATLRTSPLPKCVGSVILLFDKLDKAATAAIEVQKHSVATCDLMDRRLLRLAVESDPRYAQLVPVDTEALLIIEKVDDNVSDLREALQHIVNVIRKRKKLAFDSRMAIEADDVELHWNLTRRVVPSLYRLKGATRPLPFIEDIAVPPLKLADFSVQLQNVLKKHEITASMFAHAGHGQMHIRPFLDLANPDDVRRMEDLAKDLYEEVLSIGGTISGEHADGLSRTWYLRKQYGPLYNVFLELKRIFDPQHILNPGKIIDTRAQSISENLRPVTAIATRDADESPDETDVDADSVDKELPVLNVQLNWTGDDIALAARNCNGCGGCRTTASIERMCPIFRLGPVEESSPRAKANIMRAIMTGRLEPSTLHSDTLKQVADLCVNCHQCRLECPASVDIPKLMIEAKAQYVSNNGLTPSEWILTRLDKVAGWASAAAPMVNAGLRNRQVRWLLEKLTGIAQGRKLPQFSKRSFLKRHAKHRITRASRQGGTKVLYFIDTYANWFDVQLAESAISVLEHNNVSVFVHPRQKQSAMALISMGAIEKAKRVARQNLLLLGDAVRQGYHIVATEPSAMLCLTREYPNLLDDEDAQLVAENSSELTDFLWRMHLRGDLQLNFRPLPMTIGYHQPCHLRALEVGSPGENLMRLIPGCTVRNIDRGCSGMAGTYGFKRENYRTSLRMGMGLISALRRPDLQVGATECSACKIQMEQGTSKPTIHPIKILAYAYGLKPEIQNLFTKIGEDLIVT